MDGAASAPRAAASPDGRIPAWLGWALALLGFAVLLSWLLLAVVHLDDRYNVGWVEGTRMALARSARAGELFPPLYDGQHYGGTRFMPLPILLHAGTAAITGEYLTSGKVVAAVSTALLLALTFLILRRIGVPMPVAVCLTGGVLATRPGLLAATTVQGDALPVALQLGAIASIGASRRHAATVGAATFCVLAVAAKLSAVWAPLAIAVWLLLRDRKRLAPFLASLAVLLLAAFAILALVTDGRIVANLATLSFAGIEGSSDVVGSPLRALELALDGAAALVVLAPVALFGEPIIAGWRGLSIYFVALLAALLTLLVVLSDQGTAHNHLLDVTVLTFIVAGHVFTLAARREAVPLAPILASILAWGVAVSAIATLGPDVRAAAGSLANDGSPSTAQREVAALVGPDEPLLSEDPFVPISLDRTPVILDAWALLRVGRAHPGWIDDLAARIRAHEFGTILLVYPLSFRAWYREVHLGATVSDAIREAYRPAGTAAGYFVYVPGEGTGTQAPGSSA